MQKSLKNVLLIVSILALSLCLFTGCNDDKTSAERPDNLVVSVSVEPENGYDPTLGDGHSGGTIFHSTLFKRDADMKIVNDLATGYKVSDDGLKWTITVRDGVKCSDGSPLTAHDVAYTYSKAKTIGTVVDLHMIKSVEAISNTEVVFTIDKPQSTFINKLIIVGIVPEKIHIADPNYANNPVGSGPYKFIQWDKGSQVIAEVNPYYYGKKPIFPKVTILFLSEDQAFASIKSGEVDMAQIPATVAKEQVKGYKLKDVFSVENRGISFPMVPNTGKKDSDGNHIGNNVTCNLEIRKAINIAMNREELVEGILNGHGSPSYDGFEGVPWSNPESKFKDGDIVGAKKILADAGWADTNGDGTIDKNGVEAKFDLFYTTGEQTREALAIATRDTCAKSLGIAVNPIAGTWDDAVKVMHSVPIIMGWGDVDPSLLYNLYHSEFQGVDFYNTGYYSNPTVDEYINKALACKSEEEAIQYWKKVQWDGKTGVNEKGDNAWAYLINRPHLYMMNEHLNIGNPTPQPHRHGGVILENIMDWTWTE